MKRIFACFLAFLIVFFNMSVQATENIMTYTSTETIVRGLTYTHVQEYNATYNLSYHYVIADLTEPHLTFEFLKSPNGVDRLETLSTLSSTVPNLVTAINADFFSPVGNGLGFSIGTEIKDGELLASPVEPDKMATAILSQDDVLSFSYLDFSRTFEKEDGTSYPIRHTNKHTTWYADILLYTSDFNNGNSPAPGGSAIEIVVEDNVVTDVRRGAESVIIPENGYILLTDESMNQDLSDIQVGDSLKLHLTASVDLQEAKSAFGGGTLLVQNGELTEFTHNISGYNPRSAIGTDKSGTKVYFVAVDGRQQKSRGMTQEELAQLMIKLGCYQAINLDGGGSTRLLAASAASQVLHVANSPTENRKVINAIGISSSAKQGKLTDLEIRIPQDVMLLGDKISLQPIFFDEYNHILSDAPEPSWSFHGADGILLNNTFTPISTGKTEFSASYRGIHSNTVSIEIINDISGISIPSTLKLDVGATLMPEIYVFTKDNQSVPVHTLDAFDLNYTSSILQYEDGKIIGLDDGIGKLTLSYGNVSTTVKVIVGDGGDSLRLEQNSYEDSILSTEDSGFIFRVAAFSEETNCLNTLTANNLEEILSEGDKAALLGAPENRTADDKRIDATGFFSTELENNLFISLDISKGGLNKSVPGQWSHFMNSLESSSAKNVFLLFGNSFDDWNEGDEKSVFQDYLRTQSEKNIFVISPGERNTLSGEGGVRYFTLADSSMGSDVYDSVTSLHILSFSIQDDQVTYRWVPFYEK